MRFILILIALSASGCVTVGHAEKRDDDADVDENQKKENPLGQQRILKYSYRFLERKASMNVAKNDPQSGV